MIKWESLNLLGKSNFIFFIINLFFSFLMASIGDKGFIFHLIVSCLCYFACYCPNCRL
jgi:hypothetical protein